MSEQDYAAYWADVIEFSAILELFPYAAMRFQAAIRLQQLEDDTFEDVLEAFWWWRVDQERERLAEDTCTDPKWGEVQQAFRSLQNSFRSVYGASLILGYHDPDIGSDLDDISGPFFAVEDVYEIKKQAAALDQHLNRKTWVAYG